MADTNNDISEIQLVVFDLSSEHYGVYISDVREIMRIQSITKVPGAVSFVEGVINLRGKVLPVMDLRKRLGQKVAERTKESRIVVIDVSGGEVGVIVDAVTEVLRIPRSSIEPPSTLVAHANANYLQGIAKLADRLIILLDLEKLMAGGINLETLTEERKEEAPSKKNGQSARGKELATAVK